MAMGEWENKAKACTQDNDDDDRVGWVRKGDGGEEDRTNKIYNMRKKTRRNSVGKVESEECAYSWESLCRLIETRRLMFSSPLCSLLLQFPLFFLPLVSVFGGIYVSLVHTESEIFNSSAAPYTHRSLRSSLECYISNLFFLLFCSDRDDTRAEGGLAATRRWAARMKAARRRWGEGRRGKRTQHNTRRVWGRRVRDAANLDFLLVSPRFAPKTDKKVKKPERAMRKSIIAENAEIIPPWSCSLRWVTRRCRCCYSI